MDDACCMSDLVEINNSIISLQSSQRAGVWLCNPLTGAKWPILESVDFGNMLKSVFTIGSSSSLQPLSLSPLVMPTPTDSTTYVRAPDFAGPHYALVYPGWGLNTYSGGMSSGGVFFGSVTNSYKNATTKPQVVDLPGAKQSVKIYYKDVQI